MTLASFDSENPEKIGETHRFRTGTKLTANELLMMYDEGVRDFRRVSLLEECLVHANLWGAHLEGANLVNANLVWAKLVDTHLEEAILIDAHRGGEPAAAQKQA